MNNVKKESRRDFLKKLAATSAFAAGAFPAVLPSTVKEIPLREITGRPISPNDRIQIATIGMGIIGFIDTRTALQVPGVELVAAADLYEGRRIHTNEIFGSNVSTTLDYREILDRSDVDAVIVSTPDHWHAKIAIDAMKAGKAVYCEKPIVQDLKDGDRLIKAQQKTNQVLQVGSQFVSSIVYEKAGDLFRSGAIGELNMVEAKYNRNSAIGAWQYSIPLDASTETVDWDRFLGDAPKRPFDPVRFFRWRNYKDYGTGIPGDLYVHLFSGIHYVLGSNGPMQVVATGGLRYWKDGRDVPDIILGLYDYPRTNSHPAFSLSLQANFADGGRSGSVIKFIGNEGTMTISWEGLKLERGVPYQPSETDIVEGYNSVRTFSEATQKKFVEEYRARASAKIEKLSLDRSSQFRPPEEYDARVDHFMNFFDALRDGKTVVEDAQFGYRAASPALLTNLSYENKKIYGWDPVKMKLLS